MSLINFTDNIIDKEVITEFMIYEYIESNDSDIDYKSNEIISNFDDNFNYLYDKINFF